MIIKKGEILAIDAVSAGYGLRGTGRPNDPLELNDKITGLVEVKHDDTLSGKGTSDSHLGIANTWTKVITNLQSSASRWNTASDIVQTSAARWNTISDIVQTSASSWNKASDIVQSSASNWNNTSNIIQTSANVWNKAIESIQTSANVWNTAIESIQTSANIWNTIPKFSASDKKVYGLQNDGTVSRWVAITGGGTGETYSAGKGIEITEDTEGNKIINAYVSGNLNNGVLTIENSKIKY